MCNTEMRFLRSMEWKTTKEKIWKENIKTENKYLDDNVINNKIQLHLHVEREKETKKERTKDQMTERTNKCNERVT
jgi:hypothetical protein